MKVGELREVLARYPKEDLALLVVEMYKATPKKVKEAKDFDSMIRSVDELKKPKKRARPVSKVTLNDFESDLVRFLDLAEGGAYMGGNPLVSKNERTKWRHTAKGFYKALIAVQGTDEELRRAAALAERLFTLLCKACGIYLFHSEDPFRAIHVPQAEFFHTVATMLQRSSSPRTFLSRAARLAVTMSVDRQTLNESFFVELLSLTTTPDLLEILLEVTEELTGMLERAKTKKHDDIASYERRRSVEHCASLYLMTTFRLHEPDRGIAFFKRHYTKGNADTWEQEGALYVLLDHLADQGLTDLWQREYEAAVKRGIKPRQMLTEKYERLSASM